MVTFEEQHNETGLGPEARFVFGFETLKERARFVEGTAHTENMETLRELATEVRATPWYPARSPPVTSVNSTSVSGRC